MKKSTFGFYMFFLALVLAAFSLCENVHKNVIAEAHQYTHIIGFEEADGTDECSATAIGPHAILTASHCGAQQNLDTEKVSIDGKDVIVIGKPIRDGNDHVIYILNIRFKHYATISTQLLNVGDEVFIIGNPGGLRDILRKGYVVGYRKDRNDSNLIDILYDMNVFYGDSGSVIFNSDGQIVGVLSFTLFKIEDFAGPSIKLMGGHPLGFSSEQLKLAHKN
jgi:hypothetical protein